MVHKRPGRWEFRYTINEDRCRGPRVPRKVNAAVQTVVTLGDSYTMGMGVNDGEEYPAVLARELGETYRVLNCGSPGWGLTQEIRRFYEFALDYSPNVVILQFCANDPDDGQRDKVTRFTQGSFVFEPTRHRPNTVFNALSSCRVVQSSQLYALVRGWYESRRESGRVRAELVSRAEADYTTLLEAFARNLNSRGIRLFLISVNGQLDEFQAIRAAVHDLHGGGALQYVEAADWLKGAADRESPEGHRWGAAAHATLGRELAKVVRDSDTAHTQ